MYRLIRFMVFMLIALQGYPSMAQNARQSFRKGEELSEAGKYKDAIDQYTKSINTDPEFTKSFLFRARAYESLNDLRNAANDLNRALILDTKKKEIYYDAARLNFLLNDFQLALEMITKCLALNPDYELACRLQCRIFLALEDPTNALSAINKAISVKEDAENFFYRGKVNESLQNFTQAESDYAKSINKNDRLTDAYLALAALQLKLDKTQPALQNCNAVIAYEPANRQAFLIRGRIYATMKDFPKAIDDVSSILARNPDDRELYFIRGNYYLDFTQYQNAISDYTHALILDASYPEALYKRAYSYEQTGDLKSAIKDYEKLTRLSSTDEKAQNLLSDVRKRLFELNRETDPPVIWLTDPVIQPDSTIDVATNRNFLLIHGRIREESELNYVRINNQPANFTRNGNVYEFDARINISMVEYLTITAMDVYTNTAIARCILYRTETNSPVITLLSPYPSDNGEIYLDSPDNRITIEGTVRDESLIKSIIADSTTASFGIREHNPRFSVSIDVAGKNTFSVTAVDAYGNDTTQTFVLNRGGISSLKDNPMGKTWVVFIENSAYETFPSLEGPSKDVALMRSALDPYDIQKIIHKQNMTKMEMERFFAIELRDLLKNNHVNSLLIWYAGHGKYLENTGYWLPVDAQRNDEFTYYNLNALKASLQSYMGYLTHNLVISDACETGPSFYEAMRGSLREITCNDLASVKLKSCQVLSSAGYAGASDDSRFTQAFATSLTQNSNICLPIETVVNQILGQNEHQKAEFGKISGLADENGSFFFISKR